MFWTSVLSRLLQPLLYLLETAFLVLTPLLYLSSYVAGAPLAQTYSATTQPHIPPVSTPRHHSGLIASHHSQICFELALDTVLENYFLIMGKS